ncbi:hypothetical protein SAMN05216495_1249 [Acidaminococcus fermentans]|uniref:Uncharacterized protein n=1 Tax=Acidaminococcus fermentans TaxID=905 RepID=A0A1H3AXD4_ACIFE|nr:hypothetical protein SAMN05216495_1249 [Acidaminococcus fermentans]
MSIYNWIQKTIFNIYEEWHMKNSNYNRNGFHIDSINNSLKNMRDGYIMYTEICPPYAVRGKPYPLSRTVSKSRTPCFRQFNNPGTFKMDVW